MGRRPCLSLVLCYRAGTSGIILFDEPKSLAKALKTADGKKVVQVSIRGEQGEEDDDAEPRGLKSWVEAHKAERPGATRLQEQLDAWTETHEEEEARIKAEREAKMAEDGWTVVKSQKGRKKTKDTPSGVTVGAVTQGAATLLREKKQEQLVEDFYRFQKREKKRNEVRTIGSDALLPWWSFCAVSSQF